MTRPYNPILLAMDTSTRQIGVSLFDGLQVYCEHNWQSRDYHTVELAPMVERALDQSGVTLANLGAIAVAVGPGSFTGLRIELALAKGIALARGCALVGVPTLDILAKAQPLEDVNLAAVLRAGRGRLAVGWYQSTRGEWLSDGKLKVYSAGELLELVRTPTRLCGELTAEERHTLETNPFIRLASPLESLRRPAMLAKIGWERWQAGQVDDPASLVPTYLHYNEPIPD